MKIIVTVTALLCAKNKFFVTAENLKISLQLKLSYGARLLVYWFDEHDSLIVNVLNTTANLYIGSDKIRTYRT
jgi:hypothetical protein